jgi:hypothetical protein
VGSLVRIFEGRSGVTGLCKAFLTHVIQDHSCAILSSGVLLCWGYNLDSQVIAFAALRGRCVFVERCFCADKVFCAGW